MYLAIQTNASSFISNMFIYQIFLYHLVAFYGTMVGFYSYVFILFSAQPESLMTPNGSLLKRTDN